MGRQPELEGLWEGDVWKDIPVLLVDQFRPEGTDHRPETECKLLYDDGRIYGIFLVRDRYVRCERTNFQDPVWEDSCVEIFLRPKPDRGYFNFEFNCGGALLASYVTDSARVDGKVKSATPLTEEEGRQIDIHHSLPAVVKPEMAEECTWYLEFALPFSLMEEYVGKLGRPDGRIWRGNLYKCGNKTSHPHWASWSPLGERNFHAPWDFGELRFGG
jgi:hypothetical protein